MTLDPEFNAVKIEKVDLKIGYNPQNNYVSIGSVNLNYNVILKLPPVTKSAISGIEERANEVALVVKGHFLMHPEQLKGLGSTVHLALVNATGTITYNNIKFITTGTGSVKI